MKTLFKTALSLLLLSTLALAQDIYATFNVVAQKRATLAFTAGGTVAKRFVDVGDRVKKGQLLAALDNSEQQTMLQLAKEDYENAKLAFAQSSRSYERYKKVADILDKEKYDKIAYAMKMARIAMQKAKLMVDLRRAQLNKTLLKAPFDGTITKVYKEAGDAISGVQVMPFFDIKKLDRVKLLLDFDSRYVSVVKEGQAFSYEVDGSKKHYLGTVSKVYPSVNIKTRKIRAEVITKNLKPGLFGQGVIKAK